MVNAQSFYPKTSPTCNKFLETVDEDIQSAFNSRHSNAFARLEDLGKWKCRKALIFINSKYINSPFLIRQKLARRAGELLNDLL